MLKYWKLMRSSGITENIVLASSEEEALEILAREDLYLHDLPPERVVEVLRACINDGDKVLTPLCGVGDRVTYITCGVCAKHVDRGPGTVIAIGDAVYDYEPTARDRIPDPVLVQWDSGMRSIESAIDLTAA